MTGLFQAITAIPWGLVLIGVCASCAALIVPALFAGIAFIGAGPELRRRSTLWVHADLDQLKKAIDRAREALNAAEAHRLEDGEIQAEHAVDSEEAERITKAIEHLRAMLTKAMIQHWQRPLWFTVVQRFAGSYLMYLFFFILGVSVTLLVAQPH